MKTGTPKFWIIRTSINYGSICAPVFVAVLREKALMVAPGIFCWMN